MTIRLILETFHKNTIVILATAPPTQQDKKIGHNLGKEILKEKLGDFLKLKTWTKSSKIISKREILTNEIGLKLIQIQKKTKTNFRQWQLKAKKGSSFEN